MSLSFRVDLGWVDPADARVHFGWPMGTIGSTIAWGGFIIIIISILIFNIAFLMFISIFILFYCF